MGIPTNVPLMLQEAVFECIGKQTKVNYLSLMQQEVKPEKLDSRVAVLTNYRLLLLTTRVPGCKIDSSVHFLDILGIESQSPNKCVITLESRKLVLFEAEDGRDDIDNIICGIAELLVSIFPGKPYEGIIPNLEVVPNTRLKGIMPKLKELSEKETGPCGGYSSVYQCMCDYYGLPFMEEVAWDIDTIYLSHDTKELNLEDFDHLHSKHLVPIISALEHNQWFTGLSATNIKLTTEAFLEIVKVVKSNSTIETLKLSNNGAKWEFAQRLSVALLANPTSALTSIDLSHNLIEDRGINHLCSHLTKHSRGLVLLNLSHTGMTSRGVNRLAEAFCSNKYIAASLKTLNLSGNNIKAEDITNLHNFIAQPNALTHLNLSGMECALELLFGALKRGCTQNLSHLLLSRNVFSSRKAKFDGAVPLAWKEFPNWALSLKVVDMSDCKLPTESVRSLLLGLSSNPMVKEVELNLSGCGLCGAGSQVLEAILPSLTTIHTLDISDNGFDYDLIGLLGKLSQNQFIKKLGIGRNMNNIKPRVIPQVLEALVQLIQEEASAIESLSLRDSKLKSDLAIIINSLGSNNTLKELDISGNQMGDGGARMLAKALLLNTKLHTIYWDYNNTSPNGFQDIAAALQKNFTMKKMPTPICDASSAMKASMEKTQSALSEIEFLLQRNHSPRKFSSDQGYRLQQGFLISSSQQYVDQVVVSLQDTMASLSKASVSSRAQKDMDQAKCLIREANASQQLMPVLHDVVMKQEEDSASLDDNLKQIAGELQKAVQHQLHKSLTEMLLTAKKQCPTIMDDKAVYDEIQTSSAEKAELPKNYAQGLVCEQMGTEISNKVSELNLSIAANLSDKLIDGVIEALEKSQLTLSCHLKSPSSQKSNEDKEREQRQSLLRHKESEDTFDLDTPIPPGDIKLSTLKRKSLYSRRLRPASSIDIMEVRKTDKMSASRVAEIPEVDSNSLDLQSKELSKSVDTVNDDKPPPVPAPRRPKGDRHSAAPAVSLIKKEVSTSKGKDDIRSHAEPILECEGEGGEDTTEKTPSLPDMLEKGSDKSEDVSLTESTDLTDGSTADSLDSRESTPSVEVKTKPTKVYDGEAVDLPKMEPVSGLSHLAKNRPKRHKTHAARRPIAKSEAIIADGDHSMDTAAMDDFFASKPVTKTRSAQENSKNNQMNKQNSVDKPERKKPEKKGWSFGGDKIGKFFKKSPTHTAKTPEPAKALSTEKEPEPSFNRGEPTRRSKENDLDKEKSTRQVDEEKEKDEAKEAVRPAPRVPRPALPGMALGPGGGAALMAELKKKRESKLNQKSPEVKEGSSTGVRYLQGTMTLMPPTKESAELPKKPLPVTRTSSPGAGQDEKDSGRSSLGLSKPRPAPRPPPKPRKSGGLVPGSPTTATTGTPSTGTPTKASTGTPSTGTPTKASTGTPSTGTPSKATTGTPSTGSSTKATTGTPSTGSSTKATTGTPSTGSPAPSSSTPTSSKTHPAAPPPKPEAVDEKEGSGISSPKSSTATREGKSDDGKVSDSASDGSKKRLSVKERTALLDQNRNEQPQEGDSPSTPKSSTLPRDSTGERLGELRRPLSHPGKSDRDSVSPSILRSSKSTEDPLEGSKEPPNGSADDDESVTVYV